MADLSGKLDVLAGEFLANRVKLNCKIKDVLLVDSKFNASAGFVAADQKELIRVLDLARELKIPIAVLGDRSKYKFRSDFKGMIVKDGTKLLKIVGIKGKVGGSGIGIDEASVEIASGENLASLNKFLGYQGLKQIEEVDDNQVIISERISWDDNLRSVVEKIKIWDQGQVYRCDVIEFNKNRHVLLEVVIKMKAV